MTNKVDEILSLDAKSLSAALESKQFTCRQVMEATLDRIENLNPKCNAIISLLDREELIEKATLADQQPRMGWLHGIPIAIKDLSNVAGIPTTMGGSPLYENFVPQESDLFVEKIVDAGAIVICGGC